MQATSAFLGAALAPSRQAAAPSSAAQRGGLQVTCVATPSRPPASNKAKRSKVEIIKEKSDFLRHPLMQVRGWWVAAAASPPLPAAAAARLCHLLRCLMQ